MTRVHIFGIGLILLMLVGCSTELQSAPEESIDILFIGNSYTFFNDMPATFTKIAEFRGHQVNTTSLAKAGYSLTRHAEDQLTISTINGQNWDFVILQEKSDLPASSSERGASMYPAIRQIDKLVAERGGETVLLLTWAYQDGFPQAGLNTYQDMQAEIVVGYQSIGDELGLRIAPVGVAWEKIPEQNHQLDLWMPDGSHPSPLGSYLTAVVLYATIFNESPLDIQYVPDDIDNEAANIVIRVAAETIKSWHLP